MERAPAYDPLTTLTRRHLLLVLVGFPALYWLNGFMPWTLGLFYRQDRSCFIPFLVSICVLHAIFDVLAVAAV